jgi:hypothetical protein
MRFRTASRACSRRSKVRQPPSLSQTGTRTRVRFVHLRQPQYQVDTAALADKVAHGRVVECEDAQQLHQQPLQRRDWGGLLGR